MSNLSKEAKQVTDISARFLPNPKVLVTVLLWTLAFVNLLYGIFEWYGYWIWSSVALLGGTAVIGLEKLINRVQDSVGVKLCAMLVAGVLGFLIQVVMNTIGLRLFNLIFSGSQSQYVWARAVFTCGFGLLYAVPSLAEMIQKRASPSTQPPAEPLRGLKQQARQVTNITARWLPNPYVLVTVLLWTVAFISVIYGLFDTSDWTSIIALIGGTAVIGLEKLINRVQDSVGSRLFAMLVAGGLGFLIQIIMDPFVLDQMGVANYYGNNNHLQILPWVTAVFGAGFGLLYAIPSLAEMAENRG